MFPIFLSAFPLQYNSKGLQSYHDFTHVLILSILSDTNLNGKFSSGIEGALASTLNHDFNWKQLSEIICCLFLLMFSKFIWVTLIQKQQKYK